MNCELLKSTVTKVNYGKHRWPQHFREGIVKNLWTILLLKMKLDDHQAELQGISVVPSLPGNLFYTPEDYWRKPLYGCTSYRLRNFAIKLKVKY